MAHPAKDRVHPLRGLGDHTRTHAWTDQTDNTSPRTIATRRHSLILDMVAQHQPLPGLDSFYGLLTASAVYRTLGILALGFVLYTLREKSHSAPPLPVEREPSRLLVEGYC